MDAKKNEAYKKAKELKFLLESNGYTCSTIISAQYHFAFDIANDSVKVKALVYYGRKGLKIILQGNKEGKFYNEISDMIFEQIDLFPNKSLELDEPSVYIGTDESGKGDFFGPLVVAGVFINEEIRRKLVNLQVRDSKDLTDNQINSLSKKIKTILHNHFEVIILPPKQYNEEYKTHKNLNHMLSDLHQKVINNLLNKVECSVVIIDKFSKLEIDVPPNVKVHYIQKAEKYTAVAAASILARSEFNKWFTHKETEGVKLIKGASSEVEALARTVFRELGIDELNKLSKVHFKTYKKVTSN